MREIKFRQALYRNGKFYKFGYWGFGLIDEPKEKFFMPEISVWEGGDGSIDCTQKPEESMQFTGLKDKNGREIFEGDIVNVNFTYHKASRFPMYQTVHFTERGVMQFNEKDAQYSFLVKDSFLSNRSEIQSVEIIGNIYENPELLTTPK